MEIDVSNIDWDMLREQKEGLSLTISDEELNAKDTSHLVGILHLLDSLQDAAAEIIGEEAVFGETLKDD